MMDKHEQTIQEHIEGNLSMAIDQSHEYTDPNWTVCDAFSQNVCDSMIADGYDGETALQASNEFIKRYRIVSE